ncbi:hypothetical protein [Parasutterella excrementihominis]|uniref:hypothetical protein n=1 Tax=Parasutterella excrementihominis TaxID=487175 RepID=UPI00242A42F0|nr:hypothetical protein [Parasutterella excrementihominis]
MKKSAHDVFNRNCLQTGLKPDIPTLDAAILEGIKRFHLFNLPATAFSVPDFDETLAAYLPYPIFKVASLGRTPKESKKVFPSTADSIRLLHAYAGSEQALYIELEDRLMKAARIGSRQKFMETVIAWAYIYFFLKNRRAHRCFTALSFLLPSKTLLSYVNRFEYLLEEDEFMSREEALENQTQRIWRSLSVLKDPLILNPHLEPILQTLAPHVHQEEFPMLALELIPELYDWTSKHQERIDSNMSGALEEFSKRYAIESGIRLSNPPSTVLNKNRGVSKGRTSGYGLNIPVGISHKAFLYAFIDVVTRMASVVKHRFGLTNQKAALFVLYTLQHLPFFNLQTNFQKIKTSKLWPVLSIKDGQTFVTVAPGPFIFFTVASLRHHGPFDYQGWTAAGCPKNLTPFNSPKGFQREARKSLRQLDDCCKSFLKSYLHYRHNNG